MLKSIYYYGNCEIWGQEQLIQRNDLNTKSNSVSNKNNTYIYIFFNATTCPLRLRGLPPPGYS